MRVMPSSSRELRVSSIAMLLAFGALIAAGALPARAAERGTVQMQAAVMTEGLTVEQHLQRQAQFSAELLAQLPADRQLNRASVRLGDDEIAAIDGGEKSASPLRIGLVKPLLPSPVVLALDRGSRGEKPRRGAIGLAAPTRDGGSVWALAVSAEKAGAVRLHIEDFWLPEGAELWVYTRAGEAYGPYTGAGPDGSGEFWATTVFGSEAILQVRVGAGVTDGALEEVSFRVSEVGLLTEKFAGTLGAAAAAAGFCGNPTCIVDATCYSGASSIKDAYAKMEWIAGPYIYTCTGGLLNDSNPTQNNFFLTANHCLSKSNTAKNVTFYWRFRTASCNGACPSNTGWPYKTTGSSVKASNRRGDFTLLQLNSNPPSGSAFLGWTTTAVANSNGVALHRVSNPNFGPQVYNEQTVTTSAGTCTGWPRGERIYSRDTLGGTDGGSSGSPVVNASNLVVGQLSGACGTNVNDPCDTAANATVDGAFAYYFASVKPYLQP